MADRATCVPVDMCDPDAGERGTRIQEMATTRGVGNGAELQAGAEQLPGRHSDIDSDPKQAGRIPGPDTLPEKKEHLQADKCIDTWFFCTVANNFYLWNGCAYLLQHNSSRNMGKSIAGREYSDDGFAGYVLPAL